MNLGRTPEQMTIGQKMAYVESLGQDVAAGDLAPEEFNEIIEEHGLQEFIDDSEMPDGEIPDDEDELEEVPREKPEKKKSKKVLEEVIERPKSVLTTWEPDPSTLWRMQIPPVERGGGRIEHPETGEKAMYHPRNDAELYGFLDADDRPLVEYRYEFNEVLTDANFRGMLKESGRWSGIMSKMIMAIVVGAVIGYIWWVFSGWFEPTGSVVDVVLGTIAGMPVFVVIFVIAVLPAVAYYFSMMQAYKELMALVYIIDGHKRIIVCHYPSYSMAGRGDQLTTGEFVLSLEPCCTDSARCEHPLRNLYERDLEKGMRSAATVGVTNAKEKYEIIRRIALIAKYAPTVPFNPSERVLKMAPYIIILSICIVASFLLFNSAGGGG